MFHHTDQNLVAAIIRTYQGIYGRNPDAATITYWLKKIKDGQINVDDLQSAMYVPVVDLLTESIIEYEERGEDFDPEQSWSVASVAEVGLGLGGGGASVGGIAAAVGGIAAAAGGGGGGDSGNNNAFVQPPIVSSGGKPQEISAPPKEAATSNNATAVAEIPANNTAQQDTPATAATPAINTQEIHLFEGGHAHWLGDMFFVDLNGDGVEEVIVAGRMSVPATEQSWLESKIFVLGWNRGHFSVENDLWFDNASDSIIIGTEPDVKFGDFDGDGRQDISVSVSTDHVYQNNGPNLIFFNDINGLTRVEVNHAMTGVHGHTVADFNLDGIDDILYLSWPQGALVLGDTSRQFADAMVGYASGSSVTSGDFLNNGQNQIIITDFKYGSGSDTKLFKVDLDPINDKFNLELISELPLERFHLAEWNHLPYVTDSNWPPHSVRSLDIDFDKDGLLDTIVITSANDQDGGWHRWTEVQFLKNLGSGSFIDATDDLLMSFDHDTVPSYAPRLVDVNGDGDLDIWMAAQDYRGTENSNRVLVADDLGRYVDAWADTLEEFRGDIGGNPAPVHFMTSPNGDEYLLSMSWNLASPATFHVAPLQDYFIS